MDKGFYNLTSGMLTQTRVLNTISNNIVNAATPGFKKDTLTTTTFKEMLIQRTGNIDKSSRTPLGGNESMIRTYDISVTDYSPGGITETGRAFDFMIDGSGFFQVQNEDGLFYTRNGNFTLDEEGYLFLPGGGRVMGQGGPILLNTDDFNVDSEGNIVLGETGATAARILISDFAEEDYPALQKTGEGLFTTDAAGIANPAGSTIRWKTLEDSNVEIMPQIVDMITAQRALQSSAQVLKMVDTLNSKTVNDIARVI